MSAKYLLIIMDEGGLPLYFFPPSIESTKLNIISALISSTIALRMEAMGEVGSKIKLTTEYGDLYVYKGEQMYISLITLDKVNDEGVWFFLSDLYKKVKSIVKVPDILMIDEDFSKRITDILMASVDKVRETAFEDVKKFSEALFDSIISEKRRIPSKLRKHVKEAIFPILVDRKILSKERDVIKRRVLILCDGKHDIEDISHETGVPVDVIMMILTRYKGKVRFLPRYKIKW